jgi:indolepyruvate ferredoxin oxidoreductase alpha subunit
VTGRFPTKNNVRPSFTLKDALENPKRDVNRIVLPPASYLHEKEKIEKRWPAAVKFIQDHGLNEIFPGEAADIGIVCQGGMYNTAVRALELLGLADPFGRSQIPLYVLNVTYPLIDAEFVRFCAGKKAILVVEEGQPDFIEQAVNTILRRADLQTKIHGKDVLPMAGEYTGAVMRDGFRAFVARYRPDMGAELAPPPGDNRVKDALGRHRPNVHPRPPSFCTGCPERPIFAAMKLVERGARDAPRLLRHRLPPVLHPAALQHRRTTMGYGLGGAGAAAFNTDAEQATRSRCIGDGGFWHNGLLSSVGNAVFNKSDAVHLIVDNGYSAATGGQDILSSAAANPIRATRNSIEKAGARGRGEVGANPHPHLRRGEDARHLAGGADHEGARPKVVIAQSECMLNKQRRVRPQMAQAVREGRRVVRDRFGVDHDTCTGDHSCIRLSGCPSLTVAPHPDPLRREPVTKVIDSCVGCGMCGEVAHAAVLCPSFYKASIVTNPTRWDRWKDRARGAVIGWLQRRMAGAVA